MQRRKIIWISIAAILFLLATSIITKYNRLVSLREEVRQQQSEINNQLQRRADLIPNLVNTVKGYVKVEEGIMKEIAESRTKLLDSKNTSDKLTANDNLNQSVSKLLIIAENYPNLKSDTQFTGLRDELAGTENRVAVSRRNYNTAVENYNKVSQSFPINIFAKVFNFERFEYFKSNENAKFVPDVEF